MSTRRDERFPVYQRATVHVLQRDVHLQLFVRDISAGGLFITTDHRLERGARVEIELPMAGGGRLVLAGAVVHSISREQAAQWGRPFGVGVQFNALDPARTAQLEAYLEAVRQRLADELRAAPFETALLTQIEQGHRMGDLYRVLGLDPAAGEEQIGDALQTRSDVMNSLLAAEGVTEPLRKRVIAARLSLQQAASLLGDARRRATYILRNDLLEPEALAQHLLASPEAWDGMTGFWDESQADLATAGRALAEQARALAASGDRARAIEQALIALAKHPFLFALRRELAGWQHAA